jgi:PAS domain-containing protein
MRPAVPDPFTSRRTDRTLKESEHHLLDRITDAFVALDEEWRFVFVNPQAAEILERGRDLGRVPRPHRGSVP